LITKELGLSFVIKIPFPLLMVIGFFNEMIAKVTGGSPLVTRKGILSVRNNYWLHDISLIKKELAFSPDINFEEGMRDIIKWYKDKGLL
jgi:nucleoside-diphosphate-sugar epimerase